MIDASVARAAGDQAAPDPRSRAARAALAAVLEVCHKVVWSQRLREEWREHRSRYSRRWLVSMYARRKVVEAPASQDTGQVEMLLAGEREGINEALMKDWHLIAAAQETDGLVVSFDEEARRGFRELARRGGSLGDVVWINPELPNSGWDEGVRGDLRVTAPALRNEVDS